MEFSPHNLFIFYQLAMFEAASYNNFWDILITSFQLTNMQRAIAQKKDNNFFFKFWSGNLLIILYQLTKFKATSCNSFWDI